MATEGIANLLDDIRGGYLCRYVGNIEGTRPRCRIRVYHDLGIHVGDDSWISCCCWRGCRRHSSPPLFFGRPCFSRVHVSSHILEDGSSFRAIRRSRPRRVVAAPASPALPRFHRGPLIQYLFINLPNPCQTWCRCDTKLDDNDGEDIRIFGDVIGKGCRRCRVSDQIHRHDDEAVSREDGRNKDHGETAPST